MTKDINSLIAEDAELVDAPTDADLTLVTTLATKQLELLGNGISKGPTGDAIQGLRDWAKKNGVEEDAKLKGYSIASLIGALAQRLKEYATISEVSLPAAMKQCNLAEFKLSNGYTVTVSEDVRAAVKAGMWKEIGDWLQEHRLSDIMKSEVKLNFDLDDTGMDLTTEAGKVLLELAVKHGIITVNNLGYMVVTNQETGLTQWVQPKLTRADAVLTLAKEEGIVGEEKYSINAATLKATVKREEAKGTVFPPELFSIQKADKALVVPPKVKK